MLLFLWANSKSEVSLLINNDGLVAKGTRYRVGDITSFGYENLHAGRVVDTSTVTGGTVMASSLHGYQIYLVYGTRKVPIIVGLSEAEVAPVYDALCDLCRDHGFAFR